jgi:hydroxyacylglutathione hydrolase
VATVLRAVGSKECYSVDMIKIDYLTVGPFQSNCYIVTCTETNDAIIVDAGDEGPRILAAVDQLGVNVTTVVNTHAHLDHVSGLPEVVDALKVPVFMHRDDMPIYDAVQEQAIMFGLKPPRQIDISRYLVDGDTVTVGNLEAEVLLTPGHSPGSVCLGFWKTNPPCLIAGDVLFQGSIGRTDLPGGDHDTILRTLSERFVPMADDTVVYPGHGPDTTIGIEKKTNPFLAPLVQARNE